MNKREKFGVSKDATIAEVKEHYRREAMKHHPDRGGDINLFRDICEAYEDALAEAKEPVACLMCEGSGKVKVVRGFSSISYPCPHCGGTGHVQTEGENNGEG